MLQGTFSVSCRGDSLLYDKAPIRGPRLGLLKDGYFSSSLEKDAPRTIVRFPAAAQREVASGVSECVSVKAPSHRLRIDGETKGSCDTSIVRPCEKNPRGKLRRGVLGEARASAARGSATTPKG